MSNKTSAFIGAVAVLWMVIQVPELSFLVIPALIIGAIMVLKGEKKDWSESSVKDYGADLYKPREKWTAEDHANYKAKQIEKASQKGFNLMQQTRKGVFEMLKVELAKNGIYDIKDVPADYISQWIRKHSNTLPTVEAFQEYANTLPVNLGNELLSAVRNEARCAGIECGSRNGGTDGLVIDKVQAIKEANEAKERLFAVMDKCDDYLSGKGNPVNTKSNLKVEYAQYDDDLFS